MKLNLGPQQLEIPPGNTATIPVGSYASLTLLVYITCVSEGEMSLGLGSADSAVRIGTQPMGKAADGPTNEILPFTDPLDKDEVKN